jgi:hypothetical protein
MYLVSEGMGPLLWRASNRAKRVSNVRGDRRPRPCRGGGGGPMPVVGWSPFMSLVHVMKKSRERVKPIRLKRNRPLRVRETQ